MSLQPQINTTKKNTIINSSDFNQSLTQVAKVEVEVLHNNLLEKE